ncbi:MAG: DNA polymerase III subunit beta [Rickettsiales bacterium]|jgi:DNA polymerase-3 subunit beta|nr:DNA polymerase III subunit beta [Rickettsiales bacterium]
MSLEFSVYRQALAGALGHMQSIIEKRNTLPILSNVKIEATNSDLILTATNVDLELVERVAADVLTGGSITIPVQTFYDFVRKLPEDAEIKVKLSDAGEFVTSSGRSVFKFQTMPADNFPAMVAPSATVKFKMNTDDLARLVNQTKFAIPTDDVRYHLGGIYFHIGDDKKLTAVATDSQRLALCAITAPAGSEKMPAVILPRRLVSEVSGLLSDVKVDDVEVELSDTKIRFTIGGAVLTSKLVDAQYPNYRIVIPKANDKLAALNTKNFVHAVDLVSAASNDKTKTVQLAFSMNKMVASVSSKDDGNAVAGTEEMDIEYNSDDNFSISFNLRFLLDIANQVDGGDKMQMAMQDALSPTLIKSAAKDTDSMFILMPMRM